MNERAQVGLEYLVFTAFLLGMVVILFAYAFVTYSSSLQQAQTTAAVQQLAAAVDFVYAKGPGNAVLVDITLPAGLNEFRVDHNAVLATIAQGNGSSSLFSFTKATISPQFLFYQPGIYTLRVSMQDQNVTVQNV